MARKRNPMAQLATYCLLWGFFEFTRRLPLTAVRRLASVLARLAYNLVPRIKRVGRANLDLAYGDSLSTLEKNRILRAAVENLALVAVEFSRAPLVAAEQGHTLVDIEGLDNLVPSQGAIIVGAHLGNWEWMLPAGSLAGRSGIVVVRKFDNPRVNTLVDQVRRVCGIETVVKDAAMGLLPAKLAEGLLVGLLADQSPRDHAVPVRFFGIETWATIGPALIALRTQAPLHPASMTRDENGRYTLEFYPAIPLEQTGDLFNDLQVNTQRCQDALETMIRKHPEQWLWFHRRFKQRERLEREWQERLAGRAENAAQTPQPDTIPSPNSGA